MCQVSLAVKYITTCGLIENIHVMTTSKIGQNTHVNMKHFLPITYSLSLFLLRERERERERETEKVMFIGDI